MSFSISPKDQLAINDSVIRLAKELEKVPESFFYGITNEQFELCRKVYHYVSPIINDRAEFMYDRQNIEFATKLIKEELEKEYKRAGLSHPDIQKLSEIAKLASSYNEPSGLWGKINRVAHAYGQSKGLADQLHSDFFKSRLAEFHELTDILRFKINDSSLSSFTQFTELPLEIQGEILSHLDVGTFGNFLMVEKKALKNEENSGVWKKIEKKTGLKPLNPKIIDSLRKRILDRNVFSSYVKTPINFYSETQEFATDPRFEKVFGKMRFLSEVAKEKITEDNLRIMFEWQKMRADLNVWSQLCRTINQRVLLENFGGYFAKSLPISSDSIVKELSVMKNALQGMIPWINKNKEVITSITNLDLERSGLPEVPEIVREMKSLKTLNLKGNLLESLPEWIGELVSLETLNLADNPFQDLEALTKLPSLKKLTISLDSPQIPPSLNVEIIIDKSGSGYGYNSF